MLKSKKAFTLIEVMVAVMIISVVIMALLEMQGNASHMFLRFDKQLKISQHASFFLSNKDYGFDKKSIDLDDLLSDFSVEDELRRELKNIKVKIDYKKTEVFDMSESDDDEASSGLVLEIGKTILKVDDSSATFMRFRLQ